MHRGVGSQHGLFCSDDQIRRQTCRIHGDRRDSNEWLFVRQVFLEVLVEATRYIRFLADVVIIARRDGNL